MKRAWFAFPVLAVLLFVGCILNTGDEKYTVSGTIVTKSGEALDRVYVRLGDNAVMTNSNGYYKFTDVTYNNYFIEADPYEQKAKYRFEPVGQMIAVKQDTVINFTAYPK